MRSASSLGSHLFLFSRFKVQGSRFKVRCSVFAVLLLLCSPLIASPSEGILPTGKDGRPLNLDFETGTLQDWTATGAAFDRQPIKGDTVSPRRSDMRSQHHGNYWIGRSEERRVGKECRSWWWRQID